MIRYILNAFGLVIAMSMSLYAQDLSNDDSNTLVNEKLYMCLDRNVYCVGEEVHFRVYNTSAESIKQLGWSEVVEVEIVTSEGRSVVGGKFPFSADGASGNLKLNKNILSGNYYIRAYTKWMRNKSAKDFFYEGITILNPFNTDQLVSAIPSGGHNAVKFDTLKSNLDNRFSINQNEFGMNSYETISIHSALPDSLLHSCCVSVVKKGSVKENVLKFDSEKSASKEITFVPELRGVTISGKVINKADSLPIPFAKVWVTLQAEETVIRDVMCSDKGEFVIDLGKDYGNRNLFINATSTKEGVIPIVRIDNDYAFSLLDLPFVPFKIDDADRDWYYDLSVRSQLKQFYQVQDSMPVRQEAPRDTVESFYGTPNFSLRLKDFISMPTLEDYFRELIPMVSIRKENGKRYFHIAGIYPELQIYDPLVMVDRIKIDNADEILSISPADLERIEVVVHPFLRGDITYGGIIHFITKNNDYGKIELPEGSNIVSYSLLDTVKSVDFQQAVLMPVPFVGNCLFWNSSMDFNKGNLTINFNTGTEPGEYTLKLEGIDANNKPYEYRANLKVN